MARRQDGVVTSQNPMLYQEISELYRLLDRPGKVAALVSELFAMEDVQIQIQEITEKNGSTEFIKIMIPGLQGVSVGGLAPTLGVIGRLGGIGARPAQIGFVSDGDGALTALAVALRLARMGKNGDRLAGDIIITTHLCTNAPTAPHEPVPFMGSPVELSTMNTYEVDPSADAILSIDTSRGNRIINNNFFAITPTVKEGWILRVADDLLTHMETVTGTFAAVVPITMQDITPYGNDVYHFNSIMQPTVATTAPVVGVALTSGLPVPGCATGVVNIATIDAAGRFVLEVAKAFTAGKTQFYSEEEFARLQKRYGSMQRLQQA